ncbi:MAG: hypothetical protein R2764_00405 [Bacteroidales bacterium]
MKVIGKALSTGSKTKCSGIPNISPEDLDIFSVVDTAEEAVGAIEEFYKVCAKAEFSRQ